jgi:hypothetical protein
MERLLFWEAGAVKSYGLSNLAARPAFRGRRRCDIAQDCISRGRRPVARAPRAALRYRLTQGVGFCLPPPLRSPTLRASARLGDSWGILGGFMFAFAVRSGDFRFSVLLAMALSFLLWPAASRAYTPEEQQACSDDAFRLCGPEIPDVERVTACMVRKQSQLSPGCRVYFRSEPEVTPVATGRPLRIKPAHLRKPRKHKRPA